MIATIPFVRKGCMPGTGKCVDSSGKLHIEGEYYPAPDGCNSCTCNSYSKEETCTE